MKYLLLFENFSEVNDELLQNLENKSLMLKDYKAQSTRIKALYYDERVENPDEEASKLIDRTIIKSGKEVIKNTYLIKYASIQRDSKRVRTLEKEIEEENNRVRDLKPIDNTQRAEIAQQASDIRKKISDSVTELNLLKKKVAEESKDFEKTIKEDIAETKSEISEIYNKGK